MFKNQSRMPDYSTTRRPVFHSPDSKRPGFCSFLMPLTSQPRRLRSCFKSPTVLPPPQTTQMLYSWRPNLNGRYQASKFT